MKEVKVGMSRNASMMSECGCKPSCYEYTYDVSYSLSKWPPTGFEGVGIWIDIFENRKFLENFNETIDENRLYSDYVKQHQLDVLEDFSRINVFVRDSNVLRTVEGPDYLAFQFLSDVGGQLGIWIGVSVITLTEAFEMVFMVMRNAFCGPCKRRERTDDDMKDVQDGNGGEVSALPGDQQAPLSERETLDIATDL